MIPFTSLPVKTVAYSGVYLYTLVLLNPRKLCYISDSIVCSWCSDDEQVLQQENLKSDTGFGNIIVVDNTPVVTKEKFAKLEGVLRKVFSKVCAIKDEGFCMPVDPVTEKTVGYCFVEYNTPQVKPNSLCLISSNKMYWLYWM